MAVIKPFKAIRPINELVDKIAALPYDVMDSDEARDMVKDNPYSFLHVDKAEIDLPTDIDVYDDRVYERAKENLDKMYYEVAIIINEELYKENAITPSQYKQTEESLIEELNKK